MNCCDKYTARIVATNTLPRWFNTPEYQSPGDLVPRGTELLGVPNHHNTALFEGEYLWQAVGWGGGVRGGSNEPPLLPKRSASLVYDAYDQSLQRSHGKTSSLSQEKVTHTHIPAKKWFCISLHLSYKIMQFGPENGDIDTKYALQSWFDKCT